MGRFRDAFRRAGAHQARSMMGAVYLSPVVAPVLFLLYRQFPFRPLYWLWLFFTVTAAVFLITAAAARFADPIRSRKGRGSSWQTRELHIATIEEARRQL